MTNPAKEPEPTEPKEGGIPEWGKQLQQTVQELADKLTSSPTPANNPQPVPVPPEPQHQEPEPIVEPEPKPQPEPKPENPLKKLAAWLF